MGKIAFLFSGQGDQKSGMGKDIYYSYPSAAKVFDTLEKIRPCTKEQCFQGSEEILKQTRNTQPCIYALETAYCEILKENGIIPSCTAGFSLGEISACCFAGIFSLEDGFRLVIKRAQLMEQEAIKNNTFMAAVLKLDESHLTEICKNFKGIYPVNFNCPGQISVSGLEEEKEKFFASIKENGGRAVPLNVSGAFHSPFMEEASRRFLLELESFSLNKPSIPIYSDVTGELYTENIKELLSQQIKSPVRWEKIIRNMISSGVDTFIEIGPGKTLTNMVKKTDKDVKAYSVCDLDEVLKEVKPC